MKTAEEWAKEIVSAIPNDYEQQWWEKTERLLSEYVTQIQQDELPTSQVRAENVRLRALLRTFVDIESGRYIGYKHEVVRKLVEKAREALGETT